MGLALTPFLIMGLALTPCLFLGLALYPISAVSSFMFEHPKKIYKKKIYLSNSQRGSLLHY
jgi:hypothetical protein